METEDTALERRAFALEYAISAREPGEITSETLDRAEAFDAFLKGWEAADGDAA